jgi:hypothetical protein
VVFFHTNRVLNQYQGTLNYKHLRASHPLNS